MPAITKRESESQRGSPKKTATSRHGSPQKGSPQKGSPKKTIKGEHHFHRIFKQLQFLFTELSGSTYFLP